MSDTPRTSQAQFGTGRVSVEFTQHLERELNASNQSNIQLEGELMDAKNKYAALVADVVLYEDRGERIKRLEDIIRRASNEFFRDGSDSQTASGMLTILEEGRKP